jgi:glycosyltransferase involved in cell wall biosynthesis
MGLLKELEKRNLKILVITPAYNEEESIGEVLKEIKEKAPFVDIVVVDDASSDRTAEIAKEHNAEVLRLPINLKIGGAVQTGFKYAMLNGYDIAVQIDGDMQHDPSCLVSLIEPLIEGKADIIIGSRYLDGSSVNMPWIRNIGIRYFSWLTSRIVGYKITDCSSGFRAVNRKAIKLYSTHYPTDFPDAEALIFAHRAGLRMTEVSARFRMRKGGCSSLRSIRVIYYPLKETFAIFMMLTKRFKDYE